MFVWHGCMGGSMDVSLQWWCSEDGLSLTFAVFILKALNSYELSRLILSFSFCYSIPGVTHITENANVPGTTSSIVTITTTG